MQRWAYMASVLAVTAAPVAGASGPVSSQTVQVRIGGRQLAVPISPDLVVASPELLSVEQSAAVPLGFRLMAVLEGRSLPSPPRGARIVLIETTTDRGGRMSTDDFGKMKELARANVAMLANRPASSADGTSAEVPRVFLDESDAFAWIAPAKAESGSGDSTTPLMTGMLYVLVRGDVLVLSFRSEQALSSGSQWIEEETRWFVSGIRKANGG
jgi:hypothetical protein